MSSSLEVQLQAQQGEKSRRGLMSLKTTQKATRSKCEA
jgi:hypothetical protein